MAAEASWRLSKIDEELEKLDLVHSGSESEGYKSKETSPEPPAEAAGDIYSRIVIHKAIPPPNGARIISDKYDSLERVRNAGLATSGVPAIAEEMTETIAIAALTPPPPPPLPPQFERFSVSNTPPPPSPPPTASYVHSSNSSTMLPAPPVPFLPPPALHVSYPPAPPTGPPPPPPLPPVVASLPPKPRPTTKSLSYRAPSHSFTSTFVSEPHSPGPRVAPPPLLPRVSSYIGPTDRDDDAEDEEGEIGAGMLVVGGRAGDIMRSIRSSLSTDCVSGLSDLPAPPTLNVAQHCPTSDALLTDRLTETELMQVELFYRSHQSDVTVCACAASMKAASEVAPGNEPEWHHVRRGVPVLIMDSGRSRRARRLHLALAERGSGFVLWRETLNHLSDFRSLRPGFHSLHLAEDHAKIIGFEYDDIEAADDFSEKLAKIVSEPGDDILNLSKKKNKFRWGRKYKAPSKQSISTPCCFQHVTKLERAQGLQVIGAEFPLEDAKREANKSRRLSATVKMPRLSDLLPVEFS